MDRIIRTAPRCGALSMILAGALAVAPASAQENTQLMAEGCMYVAGHGLAQACQVSGAPPLITLSGSFDIVPHGMADGARVRCWVCEGGTCDGSGTYGPIETSYQLTAYDGQHASADWSMYVVFSPTALEQPASFPTFDSYYCRIETIRTSSQPDLPSTSWGMPDPYATSTAHRVEEGSELVTEFQGTFVEPVTGVKTKN